MLLIGYSDFGSNKISKKSLRDKKAGNFVNGKFC